MTIKPNTRLFRFLFAAVVLTLLGSISNCVNEPANLSSFSNKENWKLISGIGSWQKDPDSGEMCLTVTGGDKAGATNYWMLDYSFLPNTLYKISCKVKNSPGASGGRTIIGSSISNLDIDASERWHQHDFYFYTPSKVNNHYLRFGQWQVNGTVWFKDIELHPAKADFIKHKGLTIGNGELIKDSTFTSNCHYMSKDSNFSPSLFDFNVYFNTSRWDLKLGSYIIYKHNPGGQTISQKDAQITLIIGYYTGGELNIDAGTDNENWTPLGSINSTGRFTFQLPRELFTAKEIYIRLSTSGINPRVQINGYTYQSTLSQSFDSITGKTVYTDCLTTSKNLSAWFTANTESVQSLVLQNLSDKTNICKIINAVNSKVLNANLILKPLEAKEINLSLTPDSKQSLIIKSSDKKNPLQIEHSPRVNHLDRTDYGKLIDQTSAYALWWTDATQKVSKTRRVPSEKAPKVLMYSAKNEYEAFQFVVNASKPLKTVIVNMSDLVHRNGNRIPQALVQILNVKYVDVTRPTDSLGKADSWPDPLPPLLEPFFVKSGQNHPIWVQIKIPASASAGDYFGTLQVSIDGIKSKIPVILHVWDFTLPEETHLQTAISLYTSYIMQYHHLSNSDNIGPVLEKYLKNFKEHRISPYDPFTLGNIDVQFDTQALQAKVNFEKFDILAHKYLDQWNFNSFRVILKGLGAGSFHSRESGAIGPIKQGSHEWNTLMTDYLVKVQNHLEEKGWLNKAYIYWFDEPEPDDYAFIKNTHKFIKKAAPKLPIMLTEEPVPELYNYVDIWCPITNHYNHAPAVQRQNLGERVWWYICSGPKEPYCGLFIDHPAVELRTWIWQTWQNKLDGILIWSANYWNSEAAYPPPQMQNPYKDPMSYVHNYGLKPGDIQYWGNGDGRFIYPPESVFKTKAINLQDPVSSIRWEILREGLEDYEYFWLLNQLVIQAKNKYIDSQLIKQAEQLLIVPESVSKSLTDFNSTSGPIYEHRKAIAEMIEKLESAL